MSHPALPTIKLKIKTKLQELGISRNDFLELLKLFDDEAWAEEWQKDDHPHA